MATLSVELPDEYIDALKEIAEPLQMSLDECLLIATNYFFQFDALEYAVDGMKRVAEKVTPVAPSNLNEEFNLNLKFHPKALEEFEELAPDEQFDLILDLATRLSAGTSEEEEDDEDLEEGTDLVLRETKDTQLIISSFDFGHLVYEISNELTIYLINASGLLDFDEDEFFGEEFFDEDEESDELDEDEYEYEDEDEDEEADPDFDAFLEDEAEDEEDNPLIN